MSLKTAFLSTLCLISAQRLTAQQTTDPQPQNQTIQRTMQSLGSLRSNDHFLKSNVYAAYIMNGNERRFGVGSGGATFNNSAEFKFDWRQGDRKLYNAGGGLNIQKEEVVTFARNTTPDTSYKKHVGVYLFGTWFGKLLDQPLGRHATLSFAPFVKGTLHAEPSAGRTMYRPNATAALGGCLSLTARSNEGVWLEFGANFEGVLYYNGKPTLNMAPFLAVEFGLPSRKKALTAY